MPYQEIDDLPDRIKDNLPKHAQKIFLKAFNNAFDHYDNDEVIANKVAWSAVKKEYQKDKRSGKWVKK